MQLLLMYKSFSLLILALLLLPYQRVHALDAHFSEHTRQGIYIWSTDGTSLPVRLSKLVERYGDVFGSPHWRAVESPGLLTLYGKSEARRLSLDEHEEVVCLLEDGQQHPWLVTHINDSYRIISGTGSDRSFALVLPSDDFSCAGIIGTHLVLATTYTPAPLYRVNLVTGTTTHTPARYVFSARNAEEALFSHVSDGSSQLVRMNVSGTSISDGPLPIIPEFVGISPSGEEIIWQGWNEELLGFQTYLFENGSWNSLTPLNEAYIQGFLTESQVLYVGEEGFAIYDISQRIAHPIKIPTGLTFLGLW